ncbi:MAG: ParB/RepB/Spo0J family partition protein [Thermogemmata sp.]|nr:ParB/RepB/Spo0J family partition protein [Thermogemmata sp.]
MANSILSAALQLPDKLPARTQTTAFGQWTGQIRLFLRGAVAMVLPVTPRSGAISQWGSGSRPSVSVHEQAIGGTEAMEVMTRPRLGRGLEALLGEQGREGESGPPRTVPLQRIQRNPYQPRKHFDEEELQALTESIRSHGILQPLLVREHGDGYQLVAGERRLRAAEAAGLREVPVHIVRLDDQQLFEAALVENLHRRDLNPLEKAHSFKDYLERFGLTQEQLAHRLCLDRTTISNLLGLLHLPAEVQEAIRLGQITLGHAKALKGLTDPARQISMCKEIIMKNLSVHAVELLVRQQRLEAAGGPLHDTEGNAARPASEKTAHVQALEDELRQRLAVKVEIRVKAKDKGQIILGFSSNDDFERLIDVLRR